MNNTSPLLSTEDLQQRWSLHRESIRRMIREGRLPASRVGKREFRVPLAAVEAYEAANRYVPVYPRAVA